MILSIIQFLVNDVTAVWEALLDDIPLLAQFLPEERNVGSGLEDNFSHVIVPIMSR